MEEQLNEWQSTKINDVDIAIVFEKYVEALETDDSIDKLDNIRGVDFTSFSILCEKIDKNRFSTDYQYFSKTYTEINDYLNNKIDEMKNRYRQYYGYTCYDTLHEYFHTICLWKCGMARVCRPYRHLEYTDIYKMFNIEYRNYKFDLERYNDKQPLIDTEKELNRQKSLPRRTISGVMIQQLLKFKQHILLRINKRKDELDYYNSCLSSELKKSNLINSFCSEQYESLRKENDKDLDIIKEIDTHLGHTTIDNPTFEYQSESKLEFLQKKYDELKSRKQIPIIGIDEYWINNNYYNTHC